MRFTLPIIIFVLGVICFESCSADAIGSRANGDQLLYVKYLEDDHPAKVRKNRSITFQYRDAARIGNLTYVQFDHYDDSKNHVLSLLEGGASQHFNHITFSYEALDATYLHVYTKYYGFRSYKSLN